MINLVEHFIQRDILRTLSRKDNLSFSELRPRGIDNGIFAYHLKSLVTARLVSRVSEKYTLSHDGMKYVGWVTRTNLDLHPQPKVFCFLIIENEKGELLLHRRHAKPFLGRYTFPGGALFFDESMDDLVERQMLEKVGFKLDVEERGVANLRLEEQGEVVSHTVAYLFYGKISSTYARAFAKDKRFTPSWVNLEILTESDLMPDVRDIVKKIKIERRYFSMHLYLSS